MPDFVCVLALSDLPTQGFKAVKIGEQPFLVGRAAGQLFACVDRCPHARTPLRIGKLSGEELTCARHGWIFNVLTGACVPDNPSFTLRTIPVKIEGSSVLLAPPEDLP